MSERTGHGADVPLGKKFKSSISVQQLASSVRDRLPLDPRYALPSLLLTGTVVIGGFIYGFRNERFRPANPETSNEITRIAAIQEPNKQAEAYMDEVFRLQESSQNPKVIEAVERFERLKSDGLNVTSNSNNRLEPYVVVDKYGATYNLDIDRYLLERQPPEIQATVLVYLSEYMRHLELFVGDYKRREGDPTQAAFDRGLTRFDIVPIARAQAWETAFESVYEPGLLDGSITKSNILAPLYNRFVACSGQRYPFQCLTDEFRIDPLPADGKRA